MDSCFLLTNTLHLEFLMHVKSRPNRSLERPRRRTAVGPKAAGPS
jgi:hypothetical protein